MRQNGHAKSIQSTFSHRLDEDPAQRLVKQQSSMIELAASVSAPHRKHHEEAPAEGASAAEGRRSSGHAWFYPELPWGAPPSWQAKHKVTWYLTYWEVFMSFLCLYVGIVLPLRVGIDEVKPSEARAYHRCSLAELASPFRRPSGQIYAILDFFCDVLFLVDLLVSPRFLEASIPHTCACALSIALAGQFLHREMDYRQTWAGALETRGQAI